MRTTFWTLLVLALMFWLLILALMFWILVAVTNDTSKVDTEVFPSEVVEGYVKHLNKPLRQIASKEGPR